MFEIGMAVCAAVLGVLFYAAIHMWVKPGPARVVWAWVDLFWVLGLIYTVGTRMSEIDRTFDRADSVAQREFLARDVEILRMKAFFAARKACPYLTGASAAAPNPALCAALTQTEFDASRQEFTALDARRLEKLVTSADTGNQVRDLRLDLNGYAQRIANTASAASAASSESAPPASPYTDGIEQHRRYRNSLWVLLILFAMRVGRSVADTQRNWKTRHST